MSMRLPIERKEVDDVLAEETKWEHAQRTQGARPLASAIRPPLALPCSCAAARISPMSGFDCCAAVCPSCEHGEAFFMEIQTRSADEPASLFFRCAKCAARWREG